MDIKFLTKTKNFTKGFDVLRKATIINYELLYVLEKMLDEENVKNLDKEIIDAWIKDLSYMSPLIAHVRFISINAKLTRLSLLLYWWHCEKTNTKPHVYSDSEYVRLMNPERVNFLKQQGWGEKLKETWEVVLRVEEKGEAKTIKITSMMEPTEKLIKETMPSDLKFISILRIRKL